MLSATFGHDRTACSTLDRSDFGGFLVEHVELVVVSHLEHLGRGRHAQGIRLAPAPVDDHPHRRECTRAPAWAPTPPGPGRRSENGVSADAAGAGTMTVRFRASVLASAAAPPRRLGLPECPARCSDAEKGDGHVSRERWTFRSSTPTTTCTRRTDAFTKYLPQGVRGPHQVRRGRTAAPRSPSTA